MGVFEERYYFKYIPDNCKFISERKINKRNYVTIECSLHGLYEVRADDLKNRGCKHCKREKDKAEYAKKWKEECTEIHKGLYDYTNTIVGDVLSHSLIYCKKCKKDFKQTPASHKLGRGCPTCGRKKAAANVKKGINDIIEVYKAQGKNYDYSQVEYKTCKDKVTIICDKGHTFEKTPDQIFNTKAGCPTCNRGVNRSKGEKELYKFISKYFKCKHNTREILDGLEIDIYIPELRVGIEFNGLYWHSDDKNKTSHREKKDLAYKKGVYLIHVYEDEWKNKKEAVKRKLYETLQIREDGFKKLLRGNCKVVYRNDEEVREVYNNSALQPHTKYDGFITVMVFNTIVAVAPYSNIEKGVILVKDIVSNVEECPNNAIPFLIQWSKEQKDTEFHFLSSLDWVDYIYFYKSGIESDSVVNPKRMYIKGNRKSFEKIGDKTITNSGYIVYKI